VRCGGVGARWVLQGLGFVEDGRVLDRGLKVIDQVVDDLELARGAVVAGEAAEEGFHEVVDESGEDARRLGGVKLLDFVSPAFASDLFQRRIESAGDEFFVEAWGAVKWQAWSSEFCHRSGRFSKHLFTVPIHILGGGCGFSLLRGAHWLAEKPKQPLVDPMAATNVLRDEDSSVVAEADGPAVERLVVKRAQGEAVVGGVGTSYRAPLDVRSFDAEVGSLELSVIATDGAPVFVDPEDRVAEGRVAFERATHRDPWHADRVEDVVVVRGLPMGVEELLGDVVDEVGLSAEMSVQIRPKSTPRVDLTQFLWWDVPSRVLKTNKRISFSHFPESIFLQAPKRILGPGGAGWAEVLEECAEVVLNLGEWDQSVFATLE
jgi:hypothetical protein